LFIAINSVYANSLSLGPAPLFLRALTAINNESLRYLFKGDLLPSIFSVAKKTNNSENALLFFINKQHLKTCSWSSKNVRAVPKNNKIISDPIL